MLWLQTQVLLRKTKKGCLREKLKERWIKKQEVKEAPEASTEFKKIERPGTYTYSFKIQDKTRYYMLHVPANYNPMKETAVLFAFHGGGGNMKIQARDDFYRQISTSEKMGNIVVFPNGHSKLKSGEFATWNAGGCCGDSRDQNIDDVGFIKELLAKVREQVTIDNKRIFATGMSNGGMISYRLACEMPEVFKAIAAVAGTDNTLNCTPKSLVSILHIHAKDDENVLFNGGAGKKAVEKSKIIDFISVPATIEKWVKLNSCNPIPKRIIEVSGATCDQYTCKQGSKV